MSPAEDRLARVPPHLAVSFDPHFDPLDQTPAFDPADREPIAEFEFVQRPGA